MKQRWWELLDYSDVDNFIGYAKSTAQNLGYLRDNLARFLSPLSVSWYPYYIDTRQLNANQELVIPFPWEMHHIEMRNMTGDTVWYAFDNSAMKGRGRLDQTGEYISDPVFKELHLLPNIDGQVNGPNDCLEIIVGRRMGLL